MQWSRRVLGVRVLWLTTMLGPDSFPLDRILHGPQHARMTPDTSTGSRGILRRLTLVFISATLALVGAEVALRVVLRGKGTPYSGEDTRNSLAELRSQLTAAIPMPQGGEVNEKLLSGAAKVLHPFLAFDSPNTGKQMASDLLETRAADSEVYRVWIVGGSVAGGFGGMGAKHLKQLLEASPELEGRIVRFSRYARGGYKQPQQLIRVMHLLVSGIRADAVLNIDGFNEVAIGNQNADFEVNPTYPSFAHWMPLVNTAQAGDEILGLFVDARRKNDELVAEIDDAIEHGALWSAIIGKLRRSRVSSLHRDYDRLRGEYLAMLGEATPEASLAGPAFEGTPQQAVVEAAKTWIESSRQLKLLCDAYDMEYIHVLQPTLHDAGSKPMSKKEVEKCGIANTWLAGVEFGYPLLRTGGKRLSAEGIRFLDASMIFAAIEDTLYYDSCHFNKRGHELLAEDIAPVFLGAVRARAQR